MSELWYGVYRVWINRDTRNYGGCEWVVDGERGIDTYPGEWEKERAVMAYSRGESGAVSAFANALWPNE